MIGGKLTIAPLSHTDDEISVFIHQKFTMRGAALTLSPHFG
jgi:hypothetical protein